MRVSEIDQVDPSELNFILSSWKKSFREACPNLRTDEYYQLQGTIIDSILSRFPLLLVAHNTHGSVIGWVCAEATPDETVVHYVYVKSYARRSGIGKRLLDAALAKLEDLETQGVEAGQELVYTHKTRHHPTAERYGFKHVPAARFIREAAE